MHEEICGFIGRRYERLRCRADAEDVRNFQFNGQRPSKNGREGSLPCLWQARDGARCEEDQVPVMDTPLLRETMRSIVQCRFSSNSLAKIKVGLRLQVANN